MVERELGTVLDLGAAVAARHSVAEVDREPALRLAPFTAVPFRLPFGLFLHDEERLSQALTVVNGVDEDFQISSNPNRMSRLAIDPPHVLSSAAMTAAQEALQAFKVALKDGKGKKLGQAFARLESALAPEPEKPRGRGKPLTWESPEAMSGAIEDYFSKCAAEKRVPFVIPLADHLGLTRKGLLDYEHRDEYSYIIARAKERCAQEILERGLMKQYEPTLTRLVLSSSHGFTEKSAVEHSFKKLDGEQAALMTDEEIAAALHDAGTDS